MSITIFCYNSILVTVECLTVPLWYKQELTFVNPKFDEIRPKNDTFRPFIRLKKLPKTFGIVQLMVQFVQVYLRC